MMMRHPLYPGSTRAILVHWSLVRAKGWTSSRVINDTDTAALALTIV